jgi:hypothetical protein
MGWSSGGAEIWSPSIDAAVATAAYDMLSELVSTAPERAPFPGRARLLSALSSAYAASLDAIDDDSFKKQGIKVGHAAAEAMLDARGGRRAVRAVSVGSEPRARTLAAARLWRRAGPRPDL